MKYTYVEFADGTLVTFNDVRKDKNGEHIDVYFERPVDTGFDYLQISLPDLDTASFEGYSEAEIEDLKDFAADNAALIWEMAREVSYLRKKRELLNSGISILEYEFLASV